MRHHGAVKHDGGTSGRASCSNESKKQLAEEMKESLESPSGLIMAIKTPKSEKTVVKTCKSTDYAKKRKSQPTRKKNHLIKETLDSNGELSESATVPDGSLLPPSPENVKVKPEDENASESPTLSPPCPLNPMERTPKNGRILAMKCTRKSHISNEKTNMESDENINLEKVVAEKPSRLSEQALMDTQPDGQKIAKHTEEEANKGRKSRPVSATKSIEHSKEEDKVMPQVENETSKHLPGDELKLTTANQKKSAEKGNLLDPQNKNLSEVEKELPVVLGNPSTPDLVNPKHGSRKTKALNVIPQPQRSSTRFPCVEADHAIDIDMGGERPHALKSKNKTKDSVEELLQRGNEECAAGITTDSRQSQNSFEGGATVTSQGTMDWPDFSSTSPFGDSWPDPCLEFAFKTLTSDLPDLPVLDDAVAIQEYFQQHLFLVEGTTRPDVLAPVSSNKTNATPATDETGIKLPCEQDMLERYQSGVMEKK